VLSVKFLSFKGKKEPERRVLLHKAFIGTKVCQRLNT